MRAYGATLTFIFCLCVPSVPFFYFRLLQRVRARAASPTLAGNKYVKADMTLKVAKAYITQGRIYEGCLSLYAASGAKTKREPVCLFPVKIQAEPVMR